MKGSDRIAICIRKACKMLLERGFTLGEVQEWIYKVKQPIEGYVYVDELPIK